MSKNHFSLAAGVTATGWLPAVRVGGGPLAVRALQALAEGAAAAFDLEVWVSCLEEEDQSAPRGLVKLDPNFSAAGSTEFPEVASELYLFDAPFIWVRVRVVALTGVLDVVGVV